MIHKAGYVMAAAAAISALVALLALSCGNNAPDPFLEPPRTAVAQGTISGNLDWGIDAPWPPTVVYAIRKYESSCTGGPSTIHITGTYNGWNETAWTEEPGMTEVLPCYWVEKLSLEGDDAFRWKFVTDASWDGSYATCGDCATDGDAMTGEVRNSNENDIAVPIPEDGDYWFLLNASSDPAPFQIVREEGLPWDTAGIDSSAFRIGNLEEGVYTLVVRALERQEEFPIRVVKGIRVSGDEGTDLGTVEVVPTGFIAGTVHFGDAPDPRPTFTVEILFSESGALADSVSFGPTDTTFSITGLNEDVYDVVIGSKGYVDTTIVDVAFVPGDEIDLGAFTLVRAGAAGGFVVFGDDPDSPPAVTIDGMRAGDLEVIASTQAASDGSFLLEGLPPGAVDIRFSARKYVDTTLADVAITAGATTSVDTIVLTPGCVSVANTIHILGEFNGWDENLWVTDPGMRQTESCFWRDTVEIFPVFALTSQFKFVVDGAWGGDYALCPDIENQVIDTLAGSVCLGGDGNLTLLGNGRSGRFELTLDEDSLFFRASLIDEFTAQVSGTVAFDTGLEPPFPAIRLEARRTGETLLFATADVDEDDGSFAVEGLDGGTYDLLFTGTTFRDTMLSVTLADGQDVSLGTVTLTEVQCQSEFTVIRVVGDFNGWNASAPSMTEIEPCVWVDTVAVPASNLCSFMKFRTAEDWGDNDYFNCGAQDNTCSTPLSGDVCHGSFPGDPPALGKIEFPQAGNYEFRLDEANLTYKITLVE